MTLKRLAYGARRPTLTTLRSQTAHRATRLALPLLATTLALGCTANNVGTTSGSGGSTAEVKPTHKVNCTSDQDPTYKFLKPGSDICSCASDGGQGEAVYAGVACSAAGTNQICCADTGFPGAGNCQCFAKRNYYCTAPNGASSCKCDFYDGAASDPVISTCDNVPDSTGHAWYCCASDLFSDCSCYEAFGAGTDCPSLADRKVANCATAQAAGFAVAPASCGAQTQVTVCSAGPTKPKPSTTSTSSGPACTDIGYCSPGGNNCNCGLDCVHYGPGEYMCGFTCNQTSDCTSKTNPSTGTQYASCTTGLDTPTMTYDGFCG